MNHVQALIDAVPVMLLGVGVTVLWSLATGSRLSLILVSCVSSVTLFSLLYLIWFFRDGMGPDAVSSAGFEAARRIGIAAAAPIAGWLLVIGLAFARYRSRHPGAA